jgi:hypothetical protein
MIPRDRIDPGLEILDPVLGQFRNNLHKDLLHTVPRLFLFFEIFHANPKEEQGIPLQQNAQPVVVPAGIIALKQLLVGHMVIRSLIHG